jgi:hypothetical protein
MVKTRVIEAPYLANIVIAMYFAHLAHLHASPQGKRGGARDVQNTLLLLRLLAKGLQ